VFMKMSVRIYRNTALSLSLSLVLSFLSERVISLEC
jgi:hypothetical protein